MNCAVCAVNVICPNSFQLFTTSISAATTHPVTAINTQFRISLKLIEYKFERVANEKNLFIGLCGRK